MEETWCEKCENCGVLCGGKVFTDEEEFDEHPDREIGYNEDGEWFCSACREEEEEEEDEPVIIFNCAKCKVGIIKDSKAHDNCVTQDGKVWWCLDCSSALGEAGEESEEE